MKKKKYAVIGVSGRAYGMFMDPLIDTYHHHVTLVAMLDPDSRRMEEYNRSRKCTIPQYQPEQFDKMVKETQPDVIIVACQDSLHHDYIIKALKYNIDVISEKPLTTDVEKCSQIIRAQAESSAEVTVTFNLRYTPATTKIKELVTADKIGRVVSVDLNWYLDTHHGASYFQRWNRLRSSSGGLNIHKSCHHLDLVHWFIDQTPEEIFAYGKRNFYGSEGFHNPLTKDQIGDGRTCDDCDVRMKCPYFMRWFRNELRESAHKSAPQEMADTRDINLIYDNYSRRQCLFDPEIDIEDTYSAVIKYDGGALLNYSVNCSVPYEGFRLALNGTLGRIEYKELHAPERIPFPTESSLPSITYIPMFGARETIDVINSTGDHGGGDPLILDELLVPEITLDENLNQKAGLKEGICAVLTGHAIYESIKNNKPVKMKSLWEQVYPKTSTTKQNT